MASQCLYFVMPVHERVELTKLCLSHLRRTCDALGELDLQAGAVVVGDDKQLLEHANELGFWAVEQENVPLGRKWNDAYQQAAKLGADYFVPIGSDNWVLPEMIAGRLPGPNEVIARRRSAIVHEDGGRMCYLSVSYDGGDGIRIFPRQLLEPGNFRPAAEHARRAVDTSVVELLKRRQGWRNGYVYHDTHPLQVVGWQSHDVQLNKYADLVKGFGVGEVTGDHVWGELAQVYDPADVEEMRDLYRARARSRVA